MGLGCFADEGFATAVESRIIATDASFETFHDSGMSFRASEKVGEAYTSCAVGIRGLIPVVEEVFDRYTAMR